MDFCIKKQMEFVDTTIRVVETVTNSSRKKMRPVLMIQSLVPVYQYAVAAAMSRRPPVTFKLVSWPRHDIEFASPTPSWHKMHRKTYALQDTEKDTVLVWSSSVGAHVASRIRHMTSAGAPSYTPVILDISLRESSQPNNRLIISILTHRILVGMIAIFNSHGSLKK